MKASHRDLRNEYERLANRIARYKIKTPEVKNLMARKLRVGAAIERSRKIESRELQKLESELKKL